MQGHGKAANYNHLIWHQTLRSHAQAQSFCRGAKGCKPSAVFKILFSPPTLVLGFFVHPHSLHPGHQDPAAIRQSTHWSDNNSIKPVVKATSSRSDPPTEEWYCQGVGLTTLNYLLRSWHSKSHSVAMRVRPVLIIAQQVPWWLLLCVCARVRASVHAAATVLFTGYCAENCVRLIMWRSPVLFGRHFSKKSQRLRGRRTWTTPENRKKDWEAPSSGWERIDGYEATARWPHGGGRPFTETEQEKCRGAMIQSLNLRAYVFICTNSKLIRKGANWDKRPTINGLSLLTNTTIQNTMRNETRFNEIWIAEKRQSECEKEKCHFKIKQQMCKKWCPSIEKYQIHLK